MLCRADYSNDDYFRVFEAADDSEAFFKAGQLARNDDIVFNVFEISEEYEEIRTIF